MGEVTKDTPKILLDIKGRTVLDWQLEKLKSVNIDEVVLAAGHLSHILKKEVGEERNGVKLKYAIEKERLGTGGAIKFAWEHLIGSENGPVIILNGDILTTVPIGKMISSLDANSEGVILGARVDNASSYGTLVYDKAGHLVDFKEKEGIAKHGYINGGFYIFNPSAKKYFPDQSSFSIEYDVFPKMKHLYVYQSDDPWIDIGVPERLEWARRNW
ncbi:MAG: GDP-mannose pyrophosphorylase [Candidatus Magasanikbacteria bacterium GW2011_GWA2_46_17]|uniref:GDP-mannose pyrophosphorylase n=1 Tax=Candidatus Magasanikbacteria bacterium GW2011_GWA2_46_17 TaxID=1619042 RepID=A0A0G1P323_9BACT|nr:MAG: GDP-mannose pyrophosphorylase [Candidatus Magasanikbacteria bacterium GW2011_GWA2_46_17]